MIPAHALFELLLGEESSARHAGRVLTDSDAWDQALALAAAWKVVPRLARVLRRHEIAVPSCVDQRLRQQLTTTALQSGYVARRAADVFGALASANVRAVGFKGVATLARLHRSPAERMLSDIDIIIRDEAFDRAIKTLASIGFSPSFGESVEDWKGFSSGRIRQDNHTIALTDEEGLEVDLHYRLDGQIAGITDALWGRADSLTLVGRRVDAVAPVDAMLLLVHHSLRTHFSPFPTVRDLVDLDEYWHAADVLFDPELLGAEASRSGLGEALSAMLALLVEAGAISAGDARLLAFYDSLGPLDSGNVQRIRDWFMYRIDTPGSGGEALLDVFLLMRTPTHLRRWFAHRFTLDRKLRKAAWRTELERHRARRGKSDFGRALEMIGCLCRIGLRRLPLLWSVVRLQRRALHAVPRASEGRDAG
ncbi:nucleotidyltransferase family protein [Pseudazoarcus pumilus]|uniref:nucleotidyltransferase family protein n=1 Tax=Pseudazoarcus pumilus TaxID=2067960 RepID=UPI0013DD34C3|nr:nucleotidyltransferase family protein [Pseudazoarcus pumilus]